MNDPDPLSILAAFGAAEAPGAGPALGGMMLAVAGFILFLLLNAFFAAGEFALMLWNSLLTETQTSLSLR